MTSPVHITTKGAWLARAARPLLVVYALAMAVVLLSPTNTVQASLIQHLVELGFRADPTSWFTFPRTEKALNVVMIAPVSFLGLMAFPRSRWQEWTAYGFVASSCVELAQDLFLPGRQASTTDVVANTLGALAGGVLATLLLRALGCRRSRRRDQRGDV
jgi:glycopeptide antibiotics resistance protein